MLLMKCYVSYWNMLPEEIELVILNYKDSQELVDRRQSAASKRMCHCTYRCKYCHCERMRIFGHYRDLSGCQKNVFLGFNFKESLDRCERVKSILWFQTDPLYTLYRARLS